MKAGHRAVPKRSMKGDYSTNRHGGGQMGKAATSDEL